MAATDGLEPNRNKGVRKPSEEFSAYCEAEFERRRNSGGKFAEGRYRTAMSMVLDHLIKMEREGRS